MNADHRDTDRPGRVADRQKIVDVARVHIVAGLHVLDDAREMEQQVVRERLTNGIRLVRKGGTVPFCEGV